MTATKAKTADHTAPRLITVEQAGRMLSLSRNRIYELVSSGELRSVKIGGARRISTQAIDDFISALEATAA